MSQAMSMQLSGAPQAARGARTEKAGAAKNGGKAGAFQNLLSTLLSGLKKAGGKGEEAKKGESRSKAELSRQLPARQLPKDRKLPDAPATAKTPAVAAAAKSAETAESSAAEAKKPKKTEKKPLSEEIASSSRNRESVAAALANNADLKAVRKEGEKAAEKSEKPADAVSAQRKGKGRIDLIDARKAAQKAPAKEEAVEGAKTAEEAASPRNEKQLTIDLSGRGERSAETPASGKSKAAGEGSFSSRLAETLRDGYNAEIVKHSAVILRNDDSGLIRLNLKPESLGNVKVRLNLADNNITGTIIVESEAAKDAFEANLEHLAKSFVDSGFQDAKLQVSVDSGAAGGQGGQARHEAQPGFRPAARALDAAVPLAAPPGAYQGKAGGLSVFA